MLYRWDLGKLGGELTWVLEIGVEIEGGSPPANLFLCFLLLLLLRSSSFIWGRNIPIDFVHPRRGGGGRKGLVTRDFGRRGTGRMDLKLRNEMCQGVFSLSQCQFVVVARVRETKRESVLEKGGKLT